HWTVASASSKGLNRTLSDERIITMKCIAYGPRALLFQLAERPGEEAFNRSRAVVAEIEKQPPPGLIEYVPALTTLFLEFDPQLVPDPAQIVSRLMDQFQSALAFEAPATSIKEIPLTYDGEDLPRMSEAKQMSIAQICKLHATPVYRVYMLGFAP